MSLVACPCGESDFDRDVDVVSVSPRVLRYFGSCSRCGRDREFTFELAAPPADPDAGFVLGFGDEPSSLIDAGLWLVVSELLADNARAATDAGPLTDEQIPVLYELLRTSAACVDEILKFVPAGSDAVPDDAFWTERGLALRHAMPAFFDRDALLALQAERWQVVTDFEDEYDIEEDHDEADDAVVR